MNFFQRYLADEFAEDYSEGRISRREALKLIASVTGSLILADSILTGCTPRESKETVAAAPSDLSTGESSAAPEASPTAEAVTTKEPTPAAAYGTVMPDDLAVIAGEVQIPAGETNMRATWHVHPVKNFRL